MKMSSNNINVMDGTTLTEVDVTPKAISSKLFQCNFEAHPTGFSSDFDPNSILDVPIVRLVNRGLTTGIWERGAIDAISYPACVHNCDLKSCFAKNTRWVMLCESAFKKDPCSRYYVNVILDGLCSVGTLTAFLDLCFSKPEYAFQLARISFPESGIDIPNFIFETVLCDLVGLVSEILVEQDIAYRFDSSKVDRVSFINSAIKSDDVSAAESLAKMRIIPQYYNDCHFDNCEWDETRDDIKVSPQSANFNDFANTLLMPEVLNEIFDLQARYVGLENMHSARFAYWYNLCLDDIPNHPLVNKELLNGSSSCASGDFSSYDRAIVRVNMDDVRVVPQMLDVDRDADTEVNSQVNTPVCVDDEISRSRNNCEYLKVRLQLLQDERITKSIRVMFKDYLKNVSDDAILEISKMVNELLLNEATRRPRSCEKGIHEAIKPQGLFDHIVPKFPVEFSLSQEATNVVHQLVQTIGRIPQQEQLVNLTNSIGQKVSLSAQSVLFDLTLFIMLLIGVTQFMSIKEKNWLYMTAAVLITLLIKHSDEITPVVKQAITKVMDLLSSKNVPQGPSDYIESVVKIILGLISMKSALSFTKESKSMAKLATEIASLGKAKEGLMEIANWAQEAVLRIINYVRVDMLGINVLRSSIASAPDVDKWAQQVEAFANRAFNGDLPINIDSSMAIQAMYVQGLKFTTLYKPKEYSSIKPAIDAHMLCLKKLQSQYTNANIVGSGLRTEPFIVLFRGQPGVGKTFASKRFTTEIMCNYFKDIGDAESIRALLRNDADFFYSRNHEQVYWDGYTGQFVSFIDDLGQNITVPGQPDNEFMNLIRMAGSFQYNLHMAALEEKGRVNFQSKLVVCSTNLFNFSPAALVSVEALERRFDLVIDVFPKEEYCVPESIEAGNPLSRRLNKNHERLAQSRFCSDIYEFHVKRFVSVNKAETVRIIGWEEAVLIAAKGLRTKTEIADNYKLDEKLYIESILSEIESKVEPQGPGDAEINEDLVMEEIVKDVIQEVGSISDVKFTVKDDFKLDDIDLDIPANYGKSPMTDSYNLMLHERELIRRAFFSAEHVQICHILNAMAKLNPKVFLEANERGGSWLFRLCMYYADSDKRDWIRREARKSFMSNASDEVSISFMCRARCYMSNFLSKCKDKVANLIEKYPWIKHAVLASSLLSIVVALVGAIYSFTKPATTTDMKLPQVNVSQEWFRTRRSSGDYDNVIAEGVSGEKGRSERRETRARRANRPVVNRPEGESGERGRSQKEVKSDRRAAKPARNVPEGGYDQNTNEIEYKMMTKNLYTIVDPLGNRIGHITMIGGHIGILPGHYKHLISTQVEKGTYGLESEIKLINELSGQKKEVCILVKNLLNGKVNECLQDQDLYSVQLPVNVPMFPKVSKYFVTHNNIEKLLDFNDLTLLVPRKDMGIVEMIIDYGQKQPRVKVEADYATWYLRDTIMYPAATTNGDCGAILLSRNASLSAGRILGIHVAGSDRAGIGFSSIITREDVEDIYAMYDKELFAAPELIEARPQCYQNPTEGNFSPICFSAKELYVPPSRICKSRLYEAWGPAKTAPAVLRPVYRNGVRVDPMLKAISKYGKIHKAFKFQRMLDVAKEYYLSVLKNNTNYHKRHSPVIFDFETAVLGIPGNKFCKSLPRDTSSGYPHNMQSYSGWPGKTLYFGKDMEYDLNRKECQELKVRVLEIIECAKRGERKFHVFSDTMKDERRKLQKVQDCKTRLVSASPIDLTIATRMYFLDFQMFMMENPFTTFSAVGVDVHSDQWNVLARLLNTMGDYHIAGDYSGFDTSQFVEILLAVLWIINQWYDDEHSQVREVLFCDLYNSNHICKNMIYQWFANLPSGHPLTTIVNTIVNILLIIMCFLLSNPDGLKGISKLSSVLVIICYGDDNVINVHPSIKSYFNQNTLPLLMANFGMEYTSEYKDDHALADTRPLSAITFLKRSFRYEKNLGKYLAPLDLDVVLEIPYWFTDGMSNNFTVVQNVEVALKELSFHDKSVFDLWSERIVKASSSIIHYHPLITNYWVLQSIYMQEPEVM